MKKFASLLKAVLSQDMNFFKFNVKANSSKIKKILFPIILGIILMFAVGTYAYMFASPLAKINLTYIMLSIFIFIVTITSFMEGMYKSQGILFDSRDNDLLFSLPIKKSFIFAIRVIKLLLFQFVYNLFFILPAFVVYIYFENPSISFYLVSFLMLFLIPIIPTILAVILGYFVKSISVKFKSKKIIQTILSLLLFFGIFLLSYNLENLIANIVEKATSINEILIKIYYPIGIYINLIQNFKVLDLCKLILVNIVPLIIIIYFGSINYFKIISKSSSTNNSNKRLDINSQIKVSSPLKSLVKKELTKFFSSPVYIFNTSVGLMLMFLVSIGLCINANGIINMFINNEGINLSVNKFLDMLPFIYIEFIMFVGFMTSITSSSISLEGKSFNITKSLPVKEEVILLSKVLMSNIISLPLMLISDLIIIIRFKVSFINIILIVLFTIIIPTISAMIGLLVNLKYPKMNATNDTEVVKQSMSSMISVLIGLFMFGITIVIMIKFFNIIKSIIFIELVTFIMILIILWILIKTYGKKKFNEINI